MYHNDEIMTNWKDSVMTAEEFEAREVVSSSSSHEPPFHPYYQAALEEGKRLLGVQDSSPAKEPQFAGLTYKETEELCEKVGSREFYKHLAARFYSIPFKYVAEKHIASMNEARKEWMALYVSDSN
jgi:hypothetical protein